MSKRLVVIDGKSVFYRGYYAMPNLATKDGTPTGGVYGFAVMALEVVKKLKPDYVCVAWDKAKTNIGARKKLYEEYKANRKPAPDDFYEQIPILHELLDALGWPLYEADDYEADDIMGAFAKQAEKKKIETYLVTSDLDVLQLVSPHTHIYTLKKGLSHIELFNEKSFKAKYDIDVHQFIDLKALKGDSSDNIPGVAGVGEKTATVLLKEYGTLENVYDHLDDIKPTLRKKLEEHKDMAFLSKRLVTLMVDAPVRLDFDKARLEDGFSDEFVAMLKKLELKSLLRKVEESKPENKSSKSKKNSAISVDFRAMDFLNDKPRVLAMGQDSKDLWVSYDGSNYSVIGVKDIDSGIIKALTKGPIIGHDLKAVFRNLLSVELEFSVEVEYDTKIGSFLLNSLERQRELSDLLGRDINPDDPGEVVAGIWEVYEDQSVKFDDLPKLKELAKKIDFPMIYLLAQMENRGILLDSEYLSNMSGEFDLRIKEFEDKIHELAGKEFNIGSPAQLSIVLYEDLGLPTKGIKRGKSGYSTGAKELDKLRGLNPIIDLITYYREYAKLKNTYIDALPKLVDDEGRLHTTFNLDVTATGRLSSQNPNLQNIPTRTKIGQAIRSAFVPAKGNVFVSADYSQFELRLVAVLADDKKMIKDFNNGLDIHAATASEIYGVPLDSITKEQRRNAKVVNFGVLYGMSPHGLSAATGMDHDEAKVFIDKYFDLRSSISKYMDKIAEDAVKNGFVQTVFGRRRPTPDVKSSNFVVREAAKRAAINMPVQGVEADLMKMSMLAVEKKLDGIGEQILQIHDSILVECKKDKADKVASVLKETMENIYSLPVKLEVDVQIGSNWGEL